MATRRAAGATRAKARGATRASRPRRFLPAFLLAVAIAVAAVAFLVRDSDAGGGAGAGGSNIASYRIVYEVEEVDTSKRTEERLVRRPFHGKIVSKRGSQILSAQLSNATGGFTSSANDTKGWQLVEEGRRRAYGDAYAGIALAWAVDEGLAEERGKARVIGRECTVVRTGSPLGSPIKAISQDDYTDVCVDGAGFVLRERWWLDGKLVRSMDATELEVGAKLTDEEFEAEPRVADLPRDFSGFGRARRMDRADRMELVVEIEPPDGYRYEGGVVRERSIDRAPTITYVERFVRHGILLEVEQGRRAPEFEPQGRRVDIGGGAKGWLNVSYTASSLTLLLSDDVYIRIVGPIITDVFGVAKAIATG